MRCSNPYTTSSGHAYGCGQCMPCRLNKRREWTHRILLEANCHGDNAFVTLTYDDDHLPIRGNRASLEPLHLRYWLDRFRKSVSPLKVRYFIVGEYGDETERPHYHAAIFGFPTCAYGQSRNWVTRCCDQCELVRSTWGKGKVFLGTLESHSAQYVAGYVTKKLTHKNDERLQGRHPEFSRMSLKPGIGADFMHEVASSFMQFNLETSQGDVPSTLRHGHKELPLGRYLTKKLRTYVGRDEKTPELVNQKLAEELLPLRHAAKTDKEAPSLKRQIVKQSQGKVASLEARSKIYKQRKTL